MELTVLGATGRTGRQVVRQALDAGHGVTAVVRDRAGLRVDGSRLRVVTADVMDPHGLAPAIEGRDAVISALGPHGRGPTVVCSGGVHSAVEAMHATGVRRIVAVSAAPVAPLPPGEPLLMRRFVDPLIRRAFANVYADLTVMEEALRRGDCDWTVVRPPRLSDKPLTGVYRSVTDGAVPHGRSISRADLAHAVLAVLHAPDTIRTAVAIAY